MNSSAVLFTYNNFTLVKSRACHKTLKKKTCTKPFLSRSAMDDGLYCPVCDHFTSPNAI